MVVVWKGILCVGDAGVCKGIFVIRECGIIIGECGIIIGECGFIGGAGGVIGEGEKGELGGIVGVGFLDVESTGKDVGGLCDLGFDLFGGFESARPSDQQRKPDVLEEGGEVLFGERGGMVEEVGFGGDALAAQGVDGEGDDLVVEEADFFSESGFA